MINELLEQYRVIVLGIVGLMVVGGLGAVAWRYQPPEPIAILPPLPTATPMPIRVHVSGAVTRPDVYTLPPDAVVNDALALAGGATAEADLDAVNLAQRLTDGAQIYIPTVGEFGPPQTVVEEPPPAAEPQPAAQTEGDPAPPEPADPPEVPEEAVSGGLLNINTATAAQLDDLPGIGPVLAERIVAYRDENGPFATIDDIQNVSGIGPATFQDIAPLITAN